MSLPSLSTPYQLTGFFNCVTFLAVFVPPKAVTKQPPYFPLLLDFSVSLFFNSKGEFWASGSRFCASGCLIALEFTI